MKRASDLKYSKALAVAVALSQQHSSLQTINLKKRKGKQKAIGWRAVTRVQGEIGFVSVTLLGHWVTTGFPPTLCLTEHKNTPSALFLSLPLTLSF